MPNYELLAQDPNLDNLRSNAELKSFMDEQRALWEHFAKVL